MERLSQNATPALLLLLLTGHLAGVVASGLLGMLLPAWKIFTTSRLEWGWWRALYSQLAVAEWSLSPLTEVGLEDTVPSLSIALAFPLSICDRELSGVSKAGSLPHWQWCCIVVGWRRGMRESGFYFFIFIFIFFLVFKGLPCWARAFSSCDKQGLLSRAAWNLLIVVATLVTETGSAVRWLQ